jgi:hypothetical protein
MTRFPAKIVLLIGALCAAVASCGDNAPTEEGTGGAGGFAANTGGTGGAAGIAGTSGTGGTGGAALDPGLYATACTADISPIPYPIEFTLNATAERLVADGRASTLTTSVRVLGGGGLCPLLDTGSFLSVAEVIVTVDGAQPVEINHGLESMVPADCLFFETETRMTEITPDPGAKAVTLEITGFSMTATGLPESLVPGGEITVPSEDYPCEDIALEDGSSVIAFPVEQ